MTATVTAPPEALQALADLARAGADGSMPDVVAVLTAAGWSPPGDRWIVGSQREVAEFFGVSADAVKQWANHRSTPMPRIEAAAGKARYDLAAIAQWQRRRPGAATAARGADQDDPATAILENKARITGVAADKAEGAVVPRDEHFRKLTGLADQFAGSLRSLPDRLVRDLGLVPPEDVRLLTAADRAVADICNDLAAHVPPAPPAVGAVSAPYQ